MSGFFITIPVVRAVYEALRTTPPFRSWHLPPGDEIEFHVTIAKGWGADCLRKSNGVWRVRVNAAWVSTLDRLLQYLAHEMVHIHCDLDCPSDRAHHGARFQRAAKVVCRYHCWDYKNF